MLITVEQARQILNISRQAFWQRVYNSDRYPKPIIKHGLYLFDRDDVERVAAENKEFDSKNILASTASLLLFKNRNTLKKYLYKGFVKEFEPKKWLGEIYVSNDAFNKFYKEKASCLPLVRFLDVKKCIGLSDRKLHDFFEVTEFEKHCIPITFSPDGKIYFNRKQIEEFLAKQHLFLGSW